MDMYKKKNLKFDKNLGLGRNLRAVERSTLRAESRHTRFSLLRCLEDESENQPTEEKNEEAVSRIPTFGKPNLKAPMSRAAMLQKWKEEKQMKLQQELKSKKPTFKAGLAAPKPVSSFPSFPNTTNRFQSKSDSRMKTITESRMKTSTDSRTRFDSKSCSKVIKETSVQPSFNCKAQPSSLNNAKLLNSKESDSQSSNRKIPTTGNKNLKMKQESHIQLPNKPNTTLQKPSYISTKQSKIQETGIQIPLKPQIVPKKTSYTTTTKEVKSKFQSSSVAPKITESRNLKPPQEFHSQLPNKSKTTLQKPSFITSRQTKTELNSCKINKGPEKPSTQIKQTGIPHKNGIVPKPQSKNISKIGLPDKKKEDSSKIFKCEISHIEPSEEKSVAPKGFLFQPPIDLSFSFLDGGISAIFSKLRAGTERTSTPKRADVRVVEEDASELSFTVTKDSPRIEVFSPKLQDSVSESYNEFPGSVPEIKVKEKEYAPIDANSDFDDEKKTGLAEQDSLQNSTKQCDTNKLQTGDKSCNVAENIFKNKLEIKIQDPALNILEVSLPVLEERPLLKDLKSTELPKRNIDLQEKQKTVNLLEDTLPVFEESPLPKDLTSTEFPKQDIDLHEKQNPVNLLENSLPICEGKPFVEEVTTSEFSQQPKSDLLDDKVPIISCVEFLEAKKSDLKEVFEKELNLQKPEMQAPTLSLPEASSFTFEGRDPSIEIPSNDTKLQKENSLPEDDVSIITRCKPFTRSSEIKTRSFRRSEMQPLESINESLENSSLLESPPKPRKKEPMKKSFLCKDFTPRRSMRLAKISEPDSPEYLFDVRPSFYATPPDLKNGACNSSNITYDFDNLHLEASSTEQQPVVPKRPTTRKGKVSLLYTPPPKGRVSSVRKSIKGDLMSFSPDV